MTGCLYSQTMVGGKYIYTYVGLSALLVSTIWAMPEPLPRGTSDKTGSTFFFICMISLFILRHDGAIGKIVIIL